MSTVQDAAAHYVVTYGSLLVPEDARDQCIIESERFAMILAELGIDSEIVSGVKIGKGQMVLLGHFANKVGDEVWDWTYRQFDPECEVPRVISWDQFNQEWSMVVVRAPEGVRCGAWSWSERPKVCDDAPA